uniref:NADH dehydrogenase subunit 6 n=1 Tax=Habrobracon hebetor TaxID=69819 RepID=A0A7D5DN26_9HYME|nr:NADH dehydrogenase subunit 6 [Habrobracon hebetor]
MKNFNFEFIYFFMFFDFILIMIMILPSNLYSFHPLTLNIILIFYIIIFTLKMNFLLNSYWYSYILFLLMIGGLMILFMYFTSLMNNELFYFKLEFNIYQILKILFLLNLLYFMMKELNYLFYFMNMNYFEMKKFNLFLYFENINLFKNLFMDFSLSLNLYMIMYLFFIMLCSVLICNKIMIPLRQLLKIK